MAAVVVPVLDRGGFADGSQTLLVGLALIALALAMARDERPLAAFVRSPPIVCLGALGVLAVASAAWTVGDASAAVQAGLAVLALAAVALVAAWVTRAHGVRVVVGLIVALAVAEALCGLVSAGLRAEPWAQRLGGSWRPGGTFEYPPALVLLQVSALPALGWAMLNARRSLALGAAAGAALAGAVVALADGRVGLALAVGLLVAAIVATRPLLDLSPSRVALAAAIPVAAGVAAHLLIGGYAGTGTAAGDGQRVAAILLVAAGGAGAWALVLAALARGSAGSPSSAQPSRARGTTRLPGVRGRTALAAVGVALVLGLAGLAAFSAGSGGAGVEPVSGFDHGRAAEWGVAVDVALERPLAGAGADAYATAAAEARDGETATLFAHSLPLEAWAELGPLGLALVLGLYASVAALLWRLRRDSRAWLVAPAVAAFLLANLVDWPWHLLGAGAVWAAALGVCLALEAERRARAPVQ